MVCRPPPRGGTTGALGPGAATEVSAGEGGPAPDTPGCCVMPGCLCGPCRTRVSPPWCHRVLLHAAGRMLGTRLHLHLLHPARGRCWRTTIALFFFFFFISETSELPGPTCAAPSSDLGSSQLLCGRDPQLAITPAASWENTQGVTACLGGAGGAMWGTRTRIVLKSL